MSDTTRTILLVEDNPDDVLLILHALSQHASTYSVHVSRDGAEAIRYLLGSPESSQLDDLPEVIIMDIKMPRMNGLDVLKRIRATTRTRSVPVVLFTSSDETRDIHDGYKLGANSYVHKPTSFDDLMATIDQLARYWTGVNLPPPAVSQAD